MLIALTSIWAKAQILEAGAYALPLYVPVFFCVVLTAKVQPLSRYVPPHALVSPVSKPSRKNVAARALAVKNKPKVKEARIATTKILSVNFFNTFSPWFFYRHACVKGSTVFPQG